MVKEEHKNINSQIENVFKTTGNLKIKILFRATSAVTITNVPILAVFRIRIRIPSGQWIRIQIQEIKHDPQK